MPQKTYCCRVIRLCIHHLTKQFTYPTIRHRRNNHTRLLTIRSKTNRHRLPTLIVTYQSVRRLDQYLSKQIIARLDETARRRFSIT
jgi:hypothetical protein